MTDLNPTPDYTLADVARILRKSLETVSRWARDGKLPGAYQVTKRGRWSVRRDDFDAWRLSLGPQSNPDPYGLEAPSARSAARRKGSRRSAS